MLDDARLKLVNFKEEKLSKKYDNINEHWEFFFLFFFFRFIPFSSGFFFAPFCPSKLLIVSSSFFFRLLHSAVYRSFLAFVSRRRFSFLTWNFVDYSKMFRGYQAINARADDFHQNNTRYDEDEVDNENEVNEEEKKSYRTYFSRSRYIFLGKCHKSLHGLPTKTRNAIEQANEMKNFGNFFSLFFSPIFVNFL